MANVSRDDVEALLHGAELLDSGLEGDAEWSDAMIRQFGDQIGGERLTAFHSMCRELRLHAPAHRSQVAVAMLEHRGVTEARLDAHPSPRRTVDNGRRFEGASFTENVAGYIEAEPVGRRRDSPTDRGEPATDNVTTKQSAPEAAREERDVTQWAALLGVCALLYAVAVGSFSAFVTTMAVLVNANVADMSGPSDRTTAVVTVAFVLMTLGAILHFIAGTGLLTRKKWAWTTSLSSMFLLTPPAFVLTFIFAWRPPPPGTAPWLQNIHYIHLGVAIWPIVFFIVAHCVFGHFRMDSGWRWI